MVIYVKYGFCGALYDRLISRWEPVWKGGERGVPLRLY
jgi:hypothetical protein